MHRSSSHLQVTGMFLDEGLRPVYQLLYHTAPAALAARVTEAVQALTASGWMAEPDTLAAVTTGQQRGDGLYASVEENKLFVALATNPDGALSAMEAEAAEEEVLPDDATMAVGDRLYLEVGPLMERLGLDTVTICKVLQSWVWLCVYVGGSRF